MKYPYSRILPSSSDSRRGGLDGTTGDQERQDDARSRSEAQGTRRGVGGAQQHDPQADGGRRPPARHGQRRSVMGATYYERKDRGKRGRRSFVVVVRWQGERELQIVRSKQ